MDKPTEEPNPKARIESSSLPIFVDLDGTLILSDLLLEQCLAMVKATPWRWPRSLMWLGKGRAFFKQNLQNITQIDPATLPYNDALLADLKAAAAKGQPVYLATAADVGIAQGIADFLDIFDGILASDGKTNLIGEAKLRAIQTHTNHQPFAYVGDSKRDLPILRQAAQVMLVNPSSSVLSECQKHPNLSKVYRVGPTPLRALLKAIRPHQWVKNLLLFVPLFTAHAWRDPFSLRSAAIAFFAYCAIASATYLINDLLDLQADRHHPQKKNRPFASGALTIHRGLAAVPLLVLVGLMLGYCLGSAFLATLLLYFATSQLYSFYLKTVPLLDVTALASLFTLRIFSGAYAIDVPISQWLLAFSMFLFFSLAFVKRYAELHNLRLRGGQMTPGRGYRVADIDRLALFGIVSGFMSALVLALYIASPEIGALYTRPRFLWLICPAYLLWINWIWIIAKRGRMHEDPILFAFKDVGSYLAGIWVLASVFISL